MKKHTRIAVGCLVFVSAFFAGGCIDAARLGAADGLNSAISAVVEALVSQALAPITNGK